MHTVNALEVNPYVRFVNRLNGANSVNHIIPWRILYDFELIYVIKGKIAVCTEEEEYFIEEGMLHIMPPFKRHKRAIPDGVVTDYFSIHYDYTFSSDVKNFTIDRVRKEYCEQGEESSGLFSDLVIRDNYWLKDLYEVKKFSPLDKSKYIEFFNLIFEAYSDKAISGILRTKAYMLHILSFVIEDIKQGGSVGTISVDYVSQFIDYVFKNYDKNIDVDEIIKKCGISASRFRAGFKAVMKKSPLQFLIDYRMKQAKRFLMLGKYNVSEVCVMVGYDDIHYFSRLFKQKTGVNPSEMIKKKN